jgi:hypothetical protein
MSSIGCCENGRNQYLPVRLCRRIGSYKAKICQILKWPGYPSTGGEFKPYQSFKTHNLDVLLHLTGREEFIKTSLLTEWSAVAQWDPDVRYQAIGTTKEADAQLMISAAKLLLEKI